MSVMHLIAVIKQKNHTKNNFQSKKQLQHKITEWTTNLSKKSTDAYTNSSIFAIIIWNPMCFETKTQNRTINCTLCSWEWVRLDSSVYFMVQQLITKNYVHNLASTNFLPSNYHWCLPFHFYFFYFFAIVWFYEPQKFFFGNSAKSLYFFGIPNSHVSLFYSNNSKNYVHAYVLIQKLNKSQFLLPADAISSLCKYLNAISVGDQNKNCCFYVLVDMRVDC